MWNTILHFLWKRIFCDVASICARQLFTWLVPKLYTFPAERSEKNGQVWECTSGGIFDHRRFLVTAMVHRIRWWNVWKREKGDIVKVFLVTWGEFCKDTTELILLWAVMLQTIYPLSTSGLEKIWIMTVFLLSKRGWISRLGKQQIPRSAIRVFLMFWRPGTQ